MKDESMLERILLSALNFERRRGEDDPAFVRRWLSASETGQGFKSYLTDQAELLAMAGALVRAAGDPELKEVADELSAGASRLWYLVGLDEDQASRRMARIGGGSPEFEAAMREFGKP